MANKLFRALFLLYRVFVSNFVFRASSLSMKGPQERLKYDLRRLWECPVCKRRERVAASQTFRFCNCQMKQADGKPVGMKLIQDGVQRLTPVVAINHEQPLPVSEQTFADTTTLESRPDDPLAISDVAVSDVATPDVVIADDPKP